MKRPGRVKRSGRILKASRRASRRIDRTCLLHSLHDNPLRDGAVDELSPDDGPASLALALEVVIFVEMLHVELVFKVFK